MFWVLAISTVLAGAVLIAAWAWQSGNLGRVSGGVAAPPGAAETFNQPPPTAKQTAAKP
jgi:hypothetical protein